MKTDLLCLNPENPGEDAMESAHVEVCGKFLTHDAAYSLFHLPCRLVGEGECQDIPWVVTIEQEVGHLVGEHTRLSRPCSGNDERWSVDILYCLSLAFVELIQQVFNFGHFLLFYGNMLKQKGMVHCWGNDGMFLICRTICFCRLSNQAEGCFELRFNGFGKVAAISAQSALVSSEGCLLKLCRATAFTP